MAGDAAGAATAAEASTAATLSERRCAMRSVAAFHLGSSASAIANSIRALHADVWAIPLAARPKHIFEHLPQLAV